MFDFDITAIADEVAAANRVVYRDPFGPPYADPDRMTRTQIKAWHLMTQKRRANQIVAMIGAKGSGKTHLGSAFAFDQGQKYPGSLGCLISNSYSQTKDNGGKMLKLMANQLGYPCEFFNSKKIDGQSMQSLYVIELGGGKEFYVLVRSFDAVHKLEGIELDWLWVEEIQQAEMDAFKVVRSRVRGKNGNQAIFIAGMPEDETHWQYDLLPRVGAVEEEKYDRKPDAFRGILLEPTLYENEANVPEGYISGLFEQYDEAMAKRYIFGRRTSMRGNKVASSYVDFQHRSGRISKLLSFYDPALPLVVSIDFNVSPMCATVWQRKPWNDAWDNDDYWTEKITDQGDATEAFTGGQVIFEVAPADREVLVQVDEFEVWDGGTQGFVDAFIAKYGGHMNGGTILGDATGNRSDTRSQTTDWKILRKGISGMPSMTVMPGLVQNSNLKTGEVKYSNPPRRDTINNLNAVLKNANGEINLVFMPKSELKSGGAAKSTSSMSWRPDGNVDDSADKKPGREIPRTHFFDTVRYVAWWFRGGAATQSKEEFNAAAANLHATVTLDESDFSGGRFAGDWGGLF